jgi:hypothetical protein
VAFRFSLTTGGFTRQTLIRYRYENNSPSKSFNVSTWNILSNGPIISSLNLHIKERKNLFARLPIKSRLKGIWMVRLGNRTK